MHAKRRGIECRSKGNQRSKQDRSSTVRREGGHGQVDREGDGSLWKLSSACSYFLRKMGKMRMQERQRRLERERHKTAD